MKKNDIPGITNSIFKYENFFNVYEVNKNKYFNILKGLNIFPAPDSQIEEEYEISDEDTYYSIAYNYYGNINLWWVVCLYNQVQNPLEPLKNKKRDTLKLLRPEYVGYVVEQLRKQLD